jgi:hypothetical protein
MTQLFKKLNGIIYLVHKISSVFAQRGVNAIPLF